MAQINTLGPVGYNPTGEYDNTHEYERLDVVYYEGSSYVALKDSIGQLPTNTEYWDCIAVGYLEQNIYDSVADMKADDTLKKGMYARTVGYYSANDGGGATYKITDEESQTEYQEEISNDLYATLVINNNTNILHYGAIKTFDTATAQTANNTAIALMINNQKKLIIPTGMFYISQPITINNINVNIEGSLYYTGNDFAIIITNMSYKNFNLNFLSATTGGGIKLSPVTGKSIIYCDFNIGQIVSYNQSLLLDGTNGAITLNNFTGNRVRSSNNVAIEMSITNGSNTWISENAFIGLDIKSPVEYGVYSIASGTSVEIQYKLERCDLEDCKGVHSSSKTTFITLSNCRLGEIVSKADWLFVENTRPQIFIIGEGIIYPKNFKFENITGNVVFTNMPILVNQSGYYYNSGVVATNSILKSSDDYYMAKAITDEDLTDSHYYTLPTGYNSEQYNAFSTSVASWLDITIPNNPHYREFTFVNNVAGERTFRTSNHYTTITNMEKGYYKIYVLNSRPLYVKLEGPTA